MEDGAAVLIRHWYVVNSFKCWLQRTHTTSLQPL